MSRLACPLLFVPSSVSLLVASVFWSFAASGAFAQLTGFYVTQGLFQGENATFNFDLERNGDVARGSVGFGDDYINNSTGAAGNNGYGPNNRGFGGPTGPMGTPITPINSGDMANAIADAINKLAGREIAISSGGKVKVDPRLGNFVRWRHPPRCI